MSEKRKMTLKFILIMLACLIAGCALGVLMPHMDEEGWQLTAAGMGTAAIIATLLLVIVNVLAFGLAFAQYSKYRKLWNHGLVEEELLDGIEYRLNYPLVLSSVVMILNMFLYTADLYFLDHSEWEDTMASIMMMACIAVFILSFVWIFFLQGRLIALFKEINPEKKGYLLDLRFRKVWMDSCDEWEKVKIYKAGFQAYRSGSIACSICWVLSFVGSFALDTGLFPVLMVCIIWLVLTVSYARAAMEADKPQ